MKWQELGPSRLRVLCGKQAKENRVVFRHKAMEASSIWFFLWMSHQYLVNCSLAGRRPRLVTQNPRVREIKISIHQGERNEYHRSLSSGKPLIFTGFQDRAKKIDRRGKNPIFSGSQIFQNSGSWHVKLPPRWFAADRTAFKWETVLAISQRFHSASNTWQGDGIVNRPSSHTNVWLSCPVRYQSHMLDLVVWDHWFARS